MSEMEKYYNIAARDAIEMIEKALQKFKEEGKQAEALEMVTEELRILKAIVEAGLERQFKERKVFLAKVLADGRITIPVEWRELLKIKEGDIVKMEILEVYEGKKEKS
jgi:AbrB family looped-hinge helix DNA binding protein